MSISARPAERIVRIESETYLSLIGLCHRHGMRLSDQEIALIDEALIRMESGGPMAADHAQALRTVEERLSEEECVPIWQDTMPCVMVLDENALRHKA
jgi:hypothetical protein